MDLLAAISFSGVFRIGDARERRNVCVVSNKNIVAFSAPRCHKFGGKFSASGRGQQLQASTAGGQQNPEKDGATNTLVQKLDSLADRDYGGSCDTIFVCMLSSPWDVHDISIHNMDTDIKHLTWDSSGTRLLSADAGGLIFMSQMHESMINSWCWTNYSRSIGDDIICLKWLNIETRFSISQDLKDETAFHRKFKSSKSPVPFFGGAYDLWIAITATGMVCIGLVQQKTEMVVVKETLKLPENCPIQLADAILDTDGSIQLITSTADCTHPVRSFTIKLELESSQGPIITADACNVLCRSNPCFCIDGSQAKDRLTSLMFTDYGTGLSLYLCMKKGSQSVVQQWNMSSESFPLHREFQNRFSTAGIKRKLWVQQSCAILPGLITSSAVNPLRTDCSQIFPIGAVFASEEHKLHFISRDSVNDIWTANLPESCRGEKIISCTFSPSGCTCVLFTNKCTMLIYCEQNVHPEKLTMLLEYCMYSGISTDDVLVCLKPGLSDRVLQALEARFCRQSDGVQLQLKTRMSVIRVGLSLCSEASISLTVDHLTSLLLHHVHGIFMMAISSKQYEESEQSADDAIANLLYLGPAKTDVDYLVQQLDQVSEFLPEDGSSPIQLQPLVQWVCDLTLHILSSLPVYSLTHATGINLVRDPMCLQKLLELLLVIRIWSAHNQQLKCRPIFTCSPNIDLLAKMFRLLSLLLQSVREGINPPDHLLDECSLLSTQAVVPPFERSFCWTYLPASLLGNKVSTDVEFFEQMNSQPCLSLPFGQYITNSRVDIFSQISVPYQNAEGYKQCVRCSAVTSILKSPSEQQKTRNIPSAHYCICGGMWIRKVLQ